MLNCRFLRAVVVGGVALVFEAVPTAAPSLGVSPAWAQAAPVELTETDITKLKTLDASQWAVLSVRLGESKEAALKSLQQTSKFLGREDQREVVKGGTNEAPAVDMSYSYFKEGILLHFGIKRSADGKQVDGLREMVLVFPAKPR